MTSANAVEAPDPLLEPAVHGPGAGWPRSLHGVPGDTAAVATLAKEVAMITISGNIRNRRMSKLLGSTIRSALRLRHVRRIAGASREKRFPNRTSDTHPLLCRVPKKSVKSGRKNRYQRGTTSVPIPLPPFGMFADLGSLDLDGEPVNPENSDSACWLTHVTVTFWDYIRHMVPLHFSLIRQRSATQ